MPSGEATEDPLLLRREIGDAIASFLDDRHGDRVLVLAGENGSGRGRALHRALREAGLRGRHLRRVHLDLEGYETEGLTPASFLAHRRRALGGTVRGLEIDGVEVLTWREAARLALVAAGELAAAGGPQEDPLEAILSRLTEAEEVCLVVEEADLLPRPFVAALRARVAEQAGLWCVLRSAEREPWSWLLGDGDAAPPLRLAFSRATVDEVEESLARRGLALRPARAWAARLHARCDGLRGLLADELGRFREGEVLTADAEAAQRPAPVLPGLPRPAAELVEVLALCAGCAPAQTVLSALGRSADEIEACIDALDGACAAGTMDVVDHQYRHPSFPGGSTYQLRGRSSAARIVAAMEPQRRRSWAERLLRGLEADARFVSRGAHRLQLALCRLGSRRAQADRHRAELALWLGAGETEELAAWVATSLERGEDRPERLLAVVEEAADRWPVPRCEAVLRVLLQNPSSLRPARRGDAHRLLADLERRARRFEAARAACRRAVEAYDTCGPGHGAARVRIHLCSAGIRHAEGELEQARDELERAVAEARRGAAGGEGRTLLAASLEGLGNVLSQLGEPAAARRALEEAVETFTSLADGGERAVAVLGALSRLEADLGHLALALQHLDRALALLAEPTPGTLQASVSLLLRRFDLERRLGELRPCLETSDRLLGILAEAGLGDGSGVETRRQVVAACRSAADVAAELEDLTAARRFLRQGLRYADAGLLPAGELAVLLKNLVDVMRRLGDLQPAVAHMTRALELDRQILGVEHRTVVVDLYVLGRLLEAAGDREAARRRLQEAAHLAARVLPPGDDGHALIDRALRPSA